MKKLITMASVILLGLGLMTSVSAMSHQQLAVKAAVSTDLVQVKVTLKNGQRVGVYMPRAELSALSKGSNFNEMFSVCAGGEGCLSID